MEIQTINQFLKYFTSIRKRTMRILGHIPPDKLEWTYKDGKFTIGDLCRHIATMERHMFAENVQNKPSKYQGCGSELAEGMDEVLGLMNKLHKESLDIFSQLTDSDLQGKCITPAGTSITTWKWLRAMIEHEVHHRGQIYLYLGMLGIKTPPLYGLTAEEVEERSTQSLESLNLNYPQGIQKISASETRPIRHIVLRPHQPIEACQYPLDDAPETAHFGAYHENKLAGVASIFKEQHINFAERESWRIRGMATLTQVRGYGYGAKLLQACIAYARQNGGKLVWCNARTNVATFYGKEGMEISGDEFDLPGLGPHLLMVLRLN